MSLSMVISTTTSFNFVTPFTNFEGQKFVLQDRTRTVESYLQQMGVLTNSPCSTKVS